MLHTFSAHRRWTRPRFTTDIQPLRKIFEESPPRVCIPPTTTTPSPPTAHYLIEQSSTSSTIPANSNFVVVKSLSSPTRCSIVSNF